MLFLCLNVFIKFYKYRFYCVCVYIYIHTHRHVYSVCTQLAPLTNEHVLLDNYGSETDIWRLSKNPLLNSNLYGSHPIVLLLKQPHLFSLKYHRSYLGFILSFLKFLNYISINSSINSFRYLVLSTAIPSFDINCFLRQGTSRAASYRSSRPDVYCLLQNPVFHYCVYRNRPM